MRVAPPVLRRPRIAVIGDIHWRPGSDHPLNAVLAHIREQDVDGILAVGDFVSGPLHQSTRHRPDVLAEYHARAATCLSAVAALGRPLLWVPGNHDLPTLGRTGAPLPGINVDRGLGELAGLRVAGIGGAGPTRFGFCYEWEEQEIRALKVPDCEILLCHAPPRDTPLDRTVTGEHVGSQAIRERALAHEGALVCGHIHESADQALLGGCLVMNPGGLGAPFGGPRVGYLGGTEEGLIVDLERRTWRHLRQEAA